MRQIIWISIVFPALCAILFSCRTHHNLNYLQGNLDTGKLKKFQVPEPLIQKGDLISIMVFSDNPAATQLYNQPVVNSSTSEIGQVPGYLVDNKGNIQFQGIGLMHIEGLTKDQLAGLLDAKLKGTLLQNPYYNIRFVNLRVTMLGEFRNPGYFSIPKERVSILEAIALAGDITEFGKKENVLVIRENAGERQMNYINLTSPDLFSSPFFYLNQNDVVIVEATKRKAIVNDPLTPRNVGIVTSIVSTIVLIITVFRR